MHIYLAVPGPPAPQGSKRAFIRGRRAILVEVSQRVKPWRAAVARAAREAMGTSEPWVGPIHVSVTYQIERPQSHCCATGLRRSAPTRPGRPDIDKLLRATLDAMTGIVYRDDAQVYAVHATKLYGGPGAAAQTEISVTLMA